MSLPLITINSNESPSTADPYNLTTQYPTFMVVDDETEINQPIGRVTPRDLTRISNNLPEMMLIKITLKRY